MRITWVNTEDDELWEGEGDNGSYAIKRYHSPNMAVGLAIPEGYKVMQLRQKTGQLLKVQHVGTLEGAFARAQVWENG